MSKTTDKKEIDILTAYLPVLYAEGFEPIEEWDGGFDEETRTYTEAIPKYNEKVFDFVKAASSDFWADYKYDPKESYNRLQDTEFIKRADLQEVKSMLTYCIRGERFCDGFWGAMIEEGYIKLLLERLKVITEGYE